MTAIDIAAAFLLIVRLELVESLQRCSQALSLLIYVLELMSQQQQVAEKLHC